MEKIELNLTRKWRSSNFQEIVGQPLAVRILQNSLYLKQFFPVYLFAGQRGCGKTSTARIFAAAVNCQRLQEFQQDPRKVSIPCLSCTSCLAMQQGQHPDFIEIDAASHTGVDNVRNIIDSSSFLPLLGSKKIYLIDEAHMLSKAAFNAFLKILEEPPMSVIFILATTDMHKILETVKSRCFQVFFDPVDVQTITNHLEKICTTEHIIADISGLEIIAQQSQGSVRDAINLLEQVRFATKKITKDTVLSILGYIDQTTLLQLFEKIIQEDIHAFLLFCASFEKYELSIEQVWSALTDLVYDAILLKYQIPPRYYAECKSQVEVMITDVSCVRLNSLFALLCYQQQNLARTTKKLRFLEMILLQHIQASDLEERKKKINNAEIDQPTESDVVSGVHKQWQQYVLSLQVACQDLVLLTMFQEAHFVAFDQNSETISISFLKKFSLFADLIEKERQQWHPMLQNIFGHQVQLRHDFLRVAEQQPKQENKVFNTVQQPNKISGASLQKSNGVDISDRASWKLAHELMKHFDGVITEQK